MPPAAPTTRPSAEPITALVAARVRDLRSRSGVSQADLAERMSALGLSWTRSTVVNLETRAPGSRGKGAGRDSVTVAELLALAVVLDVPPVWLLADVESGAPTPIADDLTADPWGALLWMVGRWPLADDPGVWWARITPAIGAVLAYASAVDQVRRNQAEQQALAMDPAAAEQMAGPEEYAERDRRALRLLAANLTAIARQGLVLPPVPKDVVDRAAELGVELPSSVEG